MKNFKKLITLLLLSITSLMMLSCGTVETTKVSDSANAMSIIREYARTNGKGDTPEPQIQDYNDAKVRGVDNNETLMKINEVLKEDEVGVDEVQEPTDIQTLLYERNILEIPPVKESGGDVSLATPTPTLTPTPTPTVEPVIITLNSPLTTDGVYTVGNESLSFNPKEDFIATQGQEDVKKDIVVKIILNDNPVESYDATRIGIYQVKYLFNDTVIKELTFEIKKNSSVVENDKFELKIDVESQKIFVGDDYPIASYSVVDAEGNFQYETNFAVEKEFFSVDSKGVQSKLEELDTSKEGEYLVVYILFDKNKKVEYDRKEIKLTISAKDDSTVGGTDGESTAQPTPEPTDGKIVFKLGKDYDSRKYFANSTDDFETFELQKVVYFDFPVATKDGERIPVDQIVADKAGVFNAFTPNKLGEDQITYRLKDTDYVIVRKFKVVDSTAPRFDKLKYLVIPDSAPVVINLNDILFDAGSTNNDILLEANDIDEEKFEYNKIDKILTFKDTSVEGTYNIRILATDKQGNKTNSTQDTFSFVVEPLKIKSYNVNITEKSNKTFGSLISLSLSETVTKVVFKDGTPEEITNKFTILTKGRLKEKSALDAETEYKFELCPKADDQIGECTEIVVTTPKAKE